MAYGRRRLWAEMRASIVHEWKASTPRTIHIFICGAVISAVTSESEFSCLKTAGAGVKWRHLYLYFLFRRRKPSSASPLKPIMRFNWCFQQCFVPVHHIIIFYMLLRRTARPAQHQNRMNIYATSLAAWSCISSIVCPLSVVVRWWCSGTHQPWPYNSINVTFAIQTKPRKSYSGRPVVFALLRRRASNATNLACNVCAHVGCSRWAKFT